MTSTRQSSLGLALLRTECGSQDANGGTRNGAAKVPVSGGDAGDSTGVDATDCGVGVDRAFLAEPPRDQGVGATAVWVVEVFHEEGSPGLLPRTFFLNANTGAPCESDGTPSRGAVDDAA